MSRAIASGGLIPRPAALFHSAIRRRIGMFPCVHSPALVCRILRRFYALHTQPSCCGALSALTAFLPFAALWTSRALAGERRFVADFRGSRRCFGCPCSFLCKAVVLCLSFFSCPSVRVCPARKTALRSGKRHGLPVHRYRRKCEKAREKAQIRENNENKRNNKKTCSGREQVFVFPVLGRGSPENGRICFEKRGSMRVRCWPRPR